MSQTEINLKFPYSGLYNKGYLVKNPNGRRTVILFNSNSDRSSTSYARYLMSVKLGRFLDKCEEVDHIDEDRTNDNISNLQVLSPSDNKSKTFKKPDVGISCAECGIYFKKTLTQLRGKKSNLENGIVFCSRSCSGKRNARLRVR